MVCFDLESASGVLYKLEAAEIEQGEVRRYFCIFTNCGMSDRLRKITGIADEQTMSGVSEGETVARFLDFLKECGAVGKRQELTDGFDFLAVECAGFGVGVQLQKILFRYGIRIAFSRNAFCGDLYTYAKTFCNHLPVKSFRLSALCKHFGIECRGLQCLFFLAEKLRAERFKNADAAQCSVLREKLLAESKKQVFLPVLSDRVSADLARILLFDVRIFSDTIIKLYENTKNRKYATDDWRRVIAGTEKEVAVRAGESGIAQFEKNLSETLYAVYPLVLTYRILDGEGRIGANLIEIAYKGTKILLECGTELEPTKYGEQVRETVFQNRYDACLITHYHADHAGLIGRMQVKTSTYIGPKAKKILQTATRQPCKNVREYCGRFAVGEISVTPFLCDHSALDSYMLLFEAGGKSILYTGDFRAHGRKNFDKLLLALPKADVLLCEHTNNDGKKQWSEQTLEKKFAENMAKKHDVYVLTSATNFDRIVTVYKACLREKRLLIVDRTQAKILNSVGGSIPHPRSHKNIKVIGEKGYALADSADLQNPYTMLVRSSMGKEVEFLLETRKDALCVYSMWKGYREKEDMQKFLEIFQKKNIEIKILHSSGHADGAAIQKLIEQVCPQEIIFVHGEKA